MNLHDAVAPPITPLCHIGFLGLGSWAPLSQSIRCCVRGVGSLVAFGRQPRPCTREAPAVSSVDRNVQHATAVDP